MNICLNRLKWGDQVNIIGIDVSQGESHATLITEEAEKVAFKFKHNKSGFQILNSYIRSNTIIIFETTGVYSVARDENVKTSDVLVNSTALTDGMIVRIDSKNVDYQLNLNEDRNTYTLTQAHVIDHRVDVKN